MGEQNKRDQIVEQCRVIEHLAKAVAGVHKDLIGIYGHSKFSESDLYWDIAGSRTAAFMEQLGDMLNAMDACDPEDDWVNPVFVEAQRLWPVAPPGSVSPAELAAAVEAAERRGVERAAKWHDKQFKDHMERANVRAGWNHELALEHQHCAAAIRALAPGGAA